MSATEDRPSVFIGYAHEDQRLARAIAAGLEELGLRVWVDENELLPGDSIIEQISTAVAGVDFFCALVSEASRESNCCRKELSLAMTQGLGREGATVIPVRVGDVGMPDTLVDVLYVQLNPTDPTEAVERIAAGVRGHRRRKQQLGEKAVTQEAPAEEAESPVPEAPATASPSQTQASDAGDFEPIRMVGVVKEGVGPPRNDETRGAPSIASPFVSQGRPRLSGRSSSSARGTDRRRSPPCTGRASRMSRATPSYWTAPRWANWSSTTSPRCASWSTM